MSSSNKTITNLSNWYYITPRVERAFRIGSLASLTLDTLCTPKRIVEKPRCALSLISIDLSAKPNIRGNAETREKGVTEEFGSRPAARDRGPPSGHEYLRYSPFNIVPRERLYLATGRQSPNHYVRPTHSFRGGRGPVSASLFDRRGLSSRRLAALSPTGAERRRRERPRAAAGKRRPATKEEPSGAAARG